MNQTTNKEQEERQKVTQICQELTQSEAVLFELLVSRYPVQDTKKESEKCLQIKSAKTSRKLKREVNRRRKLKAGLKDEMERG